MKKLDCTEYQNLKDFLDKNKIILPEKKGIHVYSHNSLTETTEEPLITIFIIS